MATTTPVSHSSTDLAAAGSPVSALRLWHLLSLDAPTVATLWTWLSARACHVPLPASALFGMFLAVWMLYAADRVLDARQLFSNPLHTHGLEARHLFHHRHATAFLTGILLCSLALASLLPRFNPEALRLYTILATLLFGWFLLIHARAISSHRLPKELAVGIFFPAATFIPTIARHPELRVPLLPHAVLFAAVCTLNCLCIYAWEHPAPQSAAALSSAAAHSNAAHWTTRLCTSHLKILCLATSIAGAALTIVSFSGHRPAWPLSLASTLSVLSLLLLDRSHRRFHPLTLRAAADLVLLTPLLLLPFLV